MNIYVLLILFQAYHNHPVYSWQMRGPEHIKPDYDVTEFNISPPNREVRPSTSSTEQDISISFQNFSKMEEEPTRTACCWNNQQTTLCGSNDDVTSSVFAALHRDVDIQRQQPRMSCSQQVPGACVSQLRLPTIKSTSNVAAHLMAEESDLGYSSFTDLPMLPDINDVINISNDSDVFSDTNLSLEDMIDDVLDSINHSVPVPECLLKPECAKTTKKRVPEPTATTYSSEPREITYQPIQNLAQEYSYVPPFANVYGQTYFIVPGISETTVPADTSIPYCALCDRSFQTKASLRVHMRTHRGDRPHSCPYCDKCFTQKSTLRTHIRTHTGEKPYVCKHCTRAFSDYSTFRKHVRVHTGEKPYVCDVCKKGFTQSGNMLRHREIHFKKSAKL